MAETSHAYTFPKAEKLCGQLRIKSLYDNGKRFTCYPLRVTYIVKRPSNNCQTTIKPLSNNRQTTVLIWAPKSLFRHAVDRNRLRRLMREAYRLNSLPLKNYCRDKQLEMQLAFNYITKETLEYAQIEKAMKKAIQKLTDYENADS